jgi:predicted dehydrogenase
MTLRLAVVGLGRRGREWVRTIHAAPGFELAACVDTDPASLRHATEALSVPAPRCHTALDTALDTANPHALIVATPLDQHMAPCRAALERGVAVLVEKPFATSLREARQLHGLAARMGAPLVVGQNYRYTRLPRALRGLVRDGVLGRIGLVACQAYRGQQHVVSPSVRALPDGVLWESAVHHVDALRYVLGQEVVHVMAQIFAPPWSAGRGGVSLQALLTFESGCRVSYSASYETAGNEFFERGDRFHLRMLGEHGTVSVWQRWAVLCLRGQVPRWVRRGRRQVTEEVALLGQLEHAIRTGREPECSGRDNLRTVAVLEACARSAAAGRGIDPRELFDEPI